MTGPVAQSWEDVELPTDEIGLHESSIDLEVEQTHPAIASCMRTIISAKGDKREPVFDMMAAEAFRYARSFDVDKQSVVDRLHNVAEAIGLVEELGADKITEAIAEAIVARPKDEKPKVQSLTVVDASTLHGKPVPPRRYLCEPLIPARTVTLLTGDAVAEFNQANKSIATTIADGQAAGLSAGEHAKLRAEAQLWEAAAVAGKDKTAGLSAEISALGDKARDAAAGAEKLKLAAQIDFTNKTMFLSDRDVEIARKLVPIYGNDVPKALASSEAEVLRLQMLQQDMFDAAKRGASTFLNSLASGLLQNKSLVESLHDAFGNLASMAAQEGVKNLLGGNLLMAAVDAAVAIGSKLASGLFDDSQQKELEKAQAAWKDMAEDVSPFNTQAPKREPANDNEEKRHDRDQRRAA